MSAVHDLRTTLLFALSGASALALGLLFRVDGDFGSVWLLPFSAGVLSLALLADGIQRRWRGDERVRSTDPDERSLAAAIVGAAAFALAGLWSYARGHRPLVWGLLLALGLAGVALLGWKRRQLRRDRSIDRS